jgi:hypothetical protein
MNTRTHVGVTVEELDESDVMLNDGVKYIYGREKPFLPIAGTCVIYHMNNTHADNATW